MSQIAVCPKCAEVLVSTFKFVGREFYCLGCKCSWGFLEHGITAETPELIARAEKLQTVFDDLAKLQTKTHS